MGSGAQENGVRTLSGEKLEGGHDKQELMLYGGDVRHGVRARRRRRTRRVRFGVNNSGGFFVPGHERLEDLEEVLEEVDVDEVCKFRDAAQRRREQRRRMRVLEHAEV